MFDLACDLLLQVLIVKSNILLNFNVNSSGSFVVYFIATVIAARLEIDHYKVVNYQMQNSWVA